MVGGPGPAPDRREPVRRHRHSGRHGDAAQPVPALGAGADARASGRASAAKRTACRFNLVDSVIALNGALLVNAAILILAAAVFFKRGIVVTEIQQAHLLLAPLLGTTLAGVLFARGAAVLRPVLHPDRHHGRPDRDGRLPQLPHAALAAPPDHPHGWPSSPPPSPSTSPATQGTYKLLILSQVILSLQLPFAVIPLIHFTSDREQHGRLRQPRLGAGGWPGLWPPSSSALNIRLVSDGDRRLAGTRRAPTAGWCWVLVILVARHPARRCCSR